jgi:hypothetical protein
MRTRDLKPDFWTDEKVVQVSDAAKLLFQGLWNLADREGRLEDRPVAIGFKIRPWDPSAVPALLDELAAIGLIVRYEAKSVRVICVPTLPQHQRLHPKEMRSKLPPLPDEPGGSREKVNLFKPRSEIMPGSAGPSGSTKPAGPSGPSGPSGSSTTTTSAREPPKLVVVGKSKRSLRVGDLTPAQRNRWEALQDTREDFRLLRETDPPPSFPAWSDACDVEGIVDKQAHHAHVLFLRDRHFEVGRWATAVFITPGVFRARLPVPPREHAQ